MPTQKPPNGVRRSVVNSLIGLFVGLYAGSWFLKVFLYKGASDFESYEALLEARHSAPGLFSESITALGICMLAGFLGGLAVAFIQLWLRERAYTRALHAVSVSNNAFISMVLHHIRTPLTGIKWVLASLKSGTEEHPLTAPNLRALEMENERAILAVNKLLEAVRVSSEQTTYQIEVRPLPEAYTLLQGLIETTRAVAAAKKITLNATFDTPPQGTFIAIDREKLQIVLEALLNNAIKYTPEGGSVSVLIGAPEHLLRITVSDTGIGIPAPQQKKIFTQFFRADNARVKEPDGFGVGLFVSKTFIERLGGSITFLSEIDKGTSFMVELPLIDDAGDRYLSGLTSAPPEPMMPDPGPRI